MEFTSTRQVIKKAIEKEIEAYNLYTKTAGLVKNEATRQMLKVSHPRARTSPKTGES